MTLGPGQILQNIAIFIGQYESLLFAVCYIIGAILVVQALRLAARRSENGPQSGSWLEPVTCFISGVALLAFPTTTNIIVSTLFNTDRISSPQSMLSYKGTDSVSEFLAGTSQLVIPIVRLVQFIGLIAIARGVLILNMASSTGRGATIGPGLTFLVAGGLAVNFPDFWKLLTNLFYVNT